MNKFLQKLMQSLLLALCFAAPQLASAQGDIQTLYLVGGAKDVSWDPTKAIESIRLNNGVFMFPAVEFEGNDKQGFQILLQKGWSWPRYTPQDGGVTLRSDLSSCSAQVIRRENADKGEPNFDVYAGLYDIILDLNKNTITAYTRTLSQIDQLYIVGDDINGAKWSITDASKGRKEGNKFYFDNVNVNNYTFRFIADDKWRYNLAPLDFAPTSDGYSTVLLLNNSNNYTGHFVILDTDKYKPTNYYEPSYKNEEKEGAYNIVVDTDNYTVTATKVGSRPTITPGEITNLYLVGPTTWDPAVGIAGKREGNKFTFDHVYMHTGNFQVLIDAKGWTKRFCPGYYGEPSVELEQSNGFSTKIVYLNSDLKGDATGGEPNFDIEANKVYNVEVDLDAMTIKATEVDPYAVEKVWLMGNSINGISWSGADFSPEGVQEGNTYKFENVMIDGDFYFLVNQRDFNKKFAASGYGSSNVSLNNDNNYSAGGQIINVETKPWDSFSDPSFKLQKGVYDVVLDLDNYKVTATPRSGDIAYVKFSVKFWEGPVYKALQESKNADSDTFIPLEYYTKRESNGELVYHLHIANEIEPIKYASQMALKGHIYKANVSYNGNSFSFSNEDSRTFDPAYFDARLSDMRVPVTADYWTPKSEGSNEWVKKSSGFWCDNSRMEVGMVVRNFFLFYDPAKSYDIAKNETPIVVMASSNDSYREDAAEQPDANSDTYSLTLTSGVLYEALRGTQSGPITVPFARHHIADNGFYINIGKTISTGGENFVFNVNGKEYTKEHFVVGADGADKLIDGSEGGMTNDLGNGTTFNRIILMVSLDEHGKYEKYQFFFANNSLPAGYESFAGNLPMLKVWTGGDYVSTKWESMYKQDSYDAEDGDVRYFQFQPVTTQFGNRQTRTNLYYLDLPGGVDIKAFVPDGDDKHYDQFNIVDNNGYDISTPYQGAQVMYTDQWWCANPNLYLGESLDDVPAEFKESAVEYNGHYFKPVQQTDSRVDLVWNENTKIYGISLFKIMGHGYDVYADAVIERPLYYLYAHTKPREGTIAEKVEKTAPILLELTNGTAPATWKQYQASGKYQTSLPANNHYVLTKVDKTYTDNDDINYLPDENDFAYIPGYSQPFEFVDVTGDQRWAAPGRDDLLRSNTWSNYYTGALNTEDNITLQHPNTNYFKIVLATNPDQVRYQIMSRDITILPEGDLKYKNHNEEGHNANDLLIYPTTQIEGSLLWPKGAEEIEVTLHFVDSDGNDHTVTKIITKEEAEAHSKDSGDAFLEEGEFFFDIDLGTYCTNPDWDVYATAKVSKASENADSNVVGESLGTSATYDTCQFPEEPGVKDAEAKNTSKDGNDVGNYYADLTWTTEEHPDYDGLPREYEVNASERGNDQHKQTDSQIHTSDNAGNTDSDTEYDYLYGNHQSTGATTLDDSENGQVDIDYEITPKYHYYVPENNAAEWNDNYSYTLPEEEDDNFKLVEREGTSDTTHASFYATDATPTGIENVEVEGAAGEVEIYTLAGVKVMGEPAPGIYIVRQGGKATKTVIK